MNKIILYFFIIGLVGTASGQNNQFTNVDTSYLKPRWMSIPLAVKEYRNGSEIYKCDSEFEFAKTNKPAYFSKKVDGIDKIYYNQRVLIQSDGDTIAPKGFKVANVSDYLNYLNSFNVSKFENNSILPYELLDLNKNVLPLKFNGYLDEGFYLNPDEQFFWTPKYINGSEVGTAIKFVLGSPGKNIQFSAQEMYRGYGYSIYCIENLDEIIQDSTFEYKKLLPTEYRKLLYDLYAETKQIATSKSYTYQLKGELNCERNGLISGRFFSEFIDDGKMNKELLPKMNEIIQNFQETPYYHGKILKAHSDLSLVFKLDTIAIEKETFYLSMLKTQKVNGLEDLAFASEHSFKRNAYKESLKIEDGGIVVFKESTNYLSSFTSRGPVYAIGSILPGLGMTLLTQDNFNSDRRKAFKKTLLISSLSLGAVSLVSKLYSNHYYSRYKNDLFGSTANSNYKKANTLQKVFLTTGFGYCILGLLDFTWTFAIGSKNKSVEHKLNNQIKGSPTNFILK